MLTGSQMCFFLSKAFVMINAIGDGEHLARPKQPLRLIRPALMQEQGERARLG